MSDSEDETQDTEVAGSFLPPMDAAAEAGEAPPPDQADGASGGGGEDDGDSGGGGGQLCGQMQNKETGKTAKVVFCPDGQRLKSDKMELLKTKYWDDIVKDLNVLLACDCGTVHPTMFATLPLTQKPQFKTFWKDARTHAANQGGMGEESEDEQIKFALNVIRDVIFLRLVTIFSSLLDASDISGHWIAVDRINGPSPSAELLIEAAMGSTTARPTILVVDSMQRLSLFSSEATEACIASINAVRKAATPIGTDAGVVIPYAPYYAHDEYMYPERFLDVDLPRTPEPAHLDANGLVSDTRIIWQYHYLQTLYGPGSHYILLDKSYDAPDLTQFGSSFGYVVANGQDMMFPRLKSNIQTGEKIVMLHNTGGLTQAFTSLRRKLLSNPIAPPSNSECLDAIDYVSPAKWSDSFGLPEILMMKELMERAPMLLENTIVDVDLLYDTSEKTLNTLTCCFSGGGGVPELGLGIAENIAILTAWKRHIILFTNAVKYEKMADILQMILFVNSILTTVLAIVYSLQAGGAAQAAALLAAGGGIAGGAESAADGGSLLPTEGEAASGEEGSGVIADALAGSNPLDLIMVLLPVAASLLGAIRGRVRPREKWATCYMGAFQIVGQIYKYRLRTAEFDTAAPQPTEDKDGNPIDPIPPTKREAKARQDFVDSISQIYSVALSSEVAKGGALKIAGTYWAMTTLQHESVEKHRGKFMTLLRKHVHENIFKKGADVDSAKELLAYVKAERPLSKKVMPNPQQLNPQQLAVSQSEASGLVGKVMRVLNLQARRQVPAEKDAGVPTDLAGAVGTLGGAGGLVVAADGAGVEPPALPKSQSEGESDDGDEDDGGSNVLADNLIQQMAVESYIDYRARPFAEFLEKRAPKVSNRSQLLEYGAILCNTGGAVLAVLGMADYIPITVAAAAFCMALGDYFYIPAQLAAANGGLQELHNLLNWWDGLSLIQRKTRATKSRACQTVEAAFLNVVASRTALSAALPGEAVEEEEEE